VLGLAIPSLVVLLGLRLELESAKVLLELALGLALSELVLELALVQVWEPSHNTHLHTLQHCCHIRNHPAMLSHQVHIGQLPFWC